jgi:hypothetical protein
MTRAQANALSLALAAQDVQHAIDFAYDAQGAESASVALATGPVYSGAQLASLTTYCAAHGLTVTVIVSQMSVT